MHLIFAESPFKNVFQWICIQGQINLIDTANSKCNLEACGKSCLGRKTNIIPETKLIFDRAKILILRHNLKIGKNKSIFRDY